MPKENSEREDSEELEDKKIVRFKDLSLPLKVVIIGSWVILILVTISFLFGFMQGLSTL